MQKENIKKRFISAIIIGLTFIISIFLFRSLFYILCYLIAILMVVEWCKMTRGSKFYILGQIFIPISISSLLILSYIDQTGWILFIFFSVIWTIDTMAMIGGKLIGGIKLAPSLSPNKTISGLVIGVLSASIVSNLIFIIHDYYFPNKLLSILNFDLGTKFVIYTKLTIYTLIIALFAQASDLFISYFKRKFQIKDTGAVIPGHGGILDRFDSIIFTAPIVVAYFAMV